MGQFSLLVDGIKTTWSNRKGAQDWFNLMGGTWSNKESLLDSAKCVIYGNVTTTRNGYYPEVTEWFYRIKEIDKPLFDDWNTTRLKPHSRLK